MACVYYYMGLCNVTCVLLVNFLYFFIYLFIYTGYKTQFSQAVISDFADCNRGDC